MVGLFFRQLGALFWKNWIVLGKHPVVSNVSDHPLPIRLTYWRSDKKVEHNPVLHSTCWIWSLPLSRAVFFHQEERRRNSSDFSIPFVLSHHIQFGIGDPAAVQSFGDRFDGSLKLIWADDTGGKGSPSANDIIAYITRGFTNGQLAAISEVGSIDDIPVQCPQNFNLFSQCFAGLSFDYLPSGPNDTTPISYTILGNGGFGYINAIKHTSDYELYVLPLQWAVDQVTWKCDFCMFTS